MAPQVTNMGQMGGQWTPQWLLQGGGTEIDLSSALRAGATGRGRGGVILMYIRIGAPSTRPEAQGLGGLSPNLETNGKSSKMTF